MVQDKREESTRGMFYVVSVCLIPCTQTKWHSFVSPSFYQMLAEHTGTVLLCCLFYYTML